jgi:hypothetical protein
MFVMPRSGFGRGKPQSEHRSAQITALLEKL